MSGLIFFILSGATFLPGAILLAIAVIVRFRKQRWARFLSILSSLLAIILVIISAEALPWWLYLSWTIATLGWLFISTRTARRVISVALLDITILAAGFAISDRSGPTIPSANYRRLCIIGDSISAGLGSKQTWPAIIRDEHGALIVDFSVAGATISQASQRIQAQSFDDSVVLLEIGGNDLLSHEDAQKFGQDLEALVLQLQGKNRQLMMFELPLFPLQNEFGIQQRAIAERYHIILIPRRYFVDVLAAPGATTDGLHLSESGHRKMASLVWGFVAPLLGKGVKL